MATTTPNFGWSVPTSTDLVKDGATAIETLGDSIDASFVDLKGGTTGQVLSKASGTDLDFTWVAQDDSNAIQNTIVDAKGDLIAATAADTPARLAVGTNGQVLTADSAESTGMKWATPTSTGGMTLINTGGTTLSGSSTTVSTIPSTYKQLYIVIDDFYGAGRNYLMCEFNSDTTASNYFNGGTRGTTSTANAAYGWNSNDLSVNNVYQGDYNNKITLTLNDYASTTNKIGNMAQLFNTQTGEIAFGNGMFGYKGTSAVSSITVYILSNNWSGGKIYVYGVN
jgi:hypothetical protein